MSHTPTQGDFAGYVPRIEALAREHGLEFHPVEYELVPPEFMMEVAIYGLPLRMPHWSFGVRYIYQLVQHRMGHSRIFEVVFPGNPGHAYLAANNTVAENSLVTAHVLGHADFARNNLLFERMQQQVGGQIVEKAARHARRIAQAIEEHGIARVEAVLDAALALEQHIDIDHPVHRPRYPATPAPREEHHRDAFRQRMKRLAGEEPRGVESAFVHQSVRIPPRPERDLLWFIAHYAPEMEGWERDVFLAVREESFYFYPVFACQVMNEGWASYWHARLLREAGFLPQSLYVDAMKAHSDVVRPYAAEGQVSLQINPYHVGFRIWEHIVEHHGMGRAREVMRQDDDFSFIRNWIDEDLAHELNLFQWERRAGGKVKVAAHDLDALREQILAPRFNYGGPRLVVDELRSDGTLVLRHEYRIDGRGLDLERAQKVLEYLARVWRRPVRLHTTDRKGQETVLRTAATESS